MSRWTRTQILTASGIAVVSLLFGVLVYRHRWIADDGLIYTRIIRNILDGNGPVFNAFERVEANTSVLWPWLIALGSLVTRINPAYVQFGAGVLSSIGALAIAMDASRRWHRARGSTALLVPFGALLPLGIYAFWDFGTSGLESSLALLWIALAWWSLVALRDQASSRTELVSAFVLGLGPLVRPDLAVVSGVFLIAAYMLIRPTRRRVFTLAAVAFALPVAYELFRAGYYGMLVPNPALTKSASATAWGRGGEYLYDFLLTYRVWRIVPLFIALAVIYRRHLVGRDRLLLVAPLLSGAVLATYVVRVGGDFMHARLFLPACFLVIAPSAVVPARLYTAIAAGLVVVWAIECDLRLADGKSHTIIGDERLGYIWFTKNRHPIHPELFVRRAYDKKMLADAIAQESMVTEGRIQLPKNPAIPGAVVVAGRLGAGGAAAPLSAQVVDVLGLSNPVGSRIEITHPLEVPGHQKVLPWSWVLAEYAAPTEQHLGMFQTTADEVRAATRALGCGELAELRAAVREPLTLGRFWANLTGSVRRTRLKIPSNPRDAERAFCR